MIKVFPQNCLTKGLGEIIVKNSLCLLIFCLCLCSCHRYRDDAYYHQYEHYPNRTFTPNSGYYSKPYAIAPQKHPFFDYDQYYVLPYGYGQDNNGFPVDSR